MPDTCSHGSFGVASARAQGGRSGDDLSADRVEDVLNSLAGEFRNPLAALTSALRVLRQLGPPDARSAWVLSVFERQLAQLRRLVEELVDLSRASRGLIQLESENIAVAEILDRAAEVARPELTAHRLALRVEPSQAGLRVQGDGVRLAQALANLMDDSARRALEGGSVVLRARREGSEIVMGVNASGVGPEPSMRIERGNFRLELARQLVEQQGGRIELHDAGETAEFAIHLPIAPALEPEDKPVPVPAPPGQGAAHRILIIDDNADVADSLALLLSLSGHTVTTAYDGAAGVAAALRERPEMVLIDIGLPGLDGFEVARRLRQDEGLRGAHLVALTGFDDPEVRQRVREAGINRHLVKPVDPAALERLIRQLPFTSSEA